MQKVIKLIEFKIDQVRKKRSILEDEFYEKITQELIHRDRLEYLDHRMVVFDNIRNTLEELINDIKLLEDE